MNRKGIISITALLIMMLVFMNVTFIVYMGNLQFSLSKFSTMNIKETYACEDLLNRIIYDENKFDEYFKETILKESRGCFYKVALTEVEKIIITQEDFDSCNLEIVGKNKILNMNLEANHNDIKTLIQAEVELVNSVFKENTPIIDIKKLEDDKRQEYEEYLNLLEGLCENEEGIFQYEPRLDIGVSTSKVYKHNIYKKAEIFKDHSKDKIVLYDQENDACKDVLSSNEVRLLINVKSKVENPKAKAQLILGKKDDSLNSCEEYESLVLEGVFYVEGDLIINQDIDFQGIILINNGKLIIEETSKLIVDGMIIYRGDEDLDLNSIECSFDQQLLYVYESYLPEYINPEIRLIKKR